MSQGAQEIVQGLPHEYITVKALKKAAEHGGERESESLKIEIVREFRVRCRI